MSTYTYKNEYPMEDIRVSGNRVYIRGEWLPTAPCNGNNSTVINGKVFLDGYEFKNGKWKRTIRALWHLIF